MAIFRESVTPEVIIVSWLKLQKSLGYTVLIWVAQVMRKKKSSLFSLLLSKSKGKFIPVG